MYDLSQGMAKTMSKGLIGTQVDGVWHTGICVFGKEYYYGSGISADAVGQTPFGTPTKTISLGVTNRMEDEFLKYLKGKQDHWSEPKYEIENHNCNHFTDAASKFLLEDKGIPTDIVGQPKMIFATSFGSMMKPMMEKAQESLKAKSNSIFNTGNKYTLEQIAENQRVQKAKIEEILGKATGGKQNQQQKGAAPAPEKMKVR